MLHLILNVIIFTYKAISIGAGTWTALNIFLKLSKSVLKLRDAKTLAPDQTENSRARSQTQRCWPLKLYLFPFPCLLQGLIRWKRNLTSHSMRTYCLVWCWLFLTAKYKLCKPPAAIGVTTVPLILSYFSLLCVLLLWLQILDNEVVVGLHENLEGWLEVN